MKIVKYVIKTDGVPFLFNNDIIHSDAVNIGISAGFAIIEYDPIMDKFKVKCYGESDSLQLKSRDIDCKIIQNYLNDLLFTVKYDSVSNLSFL